MRALLLLSLLAAILWLASCQKSPVIVTSDGAGSIHGIDGIALDSSLPEAPAGYHKDNTSLWGTAYVKSGEAQIAGVAVKKDTQVFIDKGVVSSITLSLRAGSESDGAKLGEAVLAGLKAEYGSALQEAGQRAVAKDSQGRSLIFGGGATEVSITVSQPLAR